jgi:two-component system response regulator DevR
VVLEAMRAGADGFVVKAEGMRTLATMIVDLASGERVITPELERAAVEELGQVAQRAREGAEVRGILTQREREVLTLLGEGLTMRQIGRRLGISPRTVESHVAKLYRKLGVATRVQALARAATLGLIELE